MELAAPPGKRWEDVADCEGRQLLRRLELEKWALPMVMPGQRQTLSKRVGSAEVLGLG